MNTDNLIQEIILDFGFFDAHGHFRGDEILREVVPHTAKYAHGAIVMPNTAPPITTVEMAKEYRKEILRASNGHNFTPYLTAYLTDDTDPDEIERGFAEKVWVAAKLYPLLGTTGAQNGVSSVRNMARVFKRMEKINMPLLCHGELVSEELDPLDMEAAFIEHTFKNQILEEFGMPIVLEHITTMESAELVGSGKFRNLFATITPHHLLFSHKHLFQKGKMSDKSFKRGIRPNFFCLPLLKKEEHREALRALVASGCKQVGAGTDSAPHNASTKYQDCGCAGCFVAPCAIQMYATAFAKAGALDKLAPFLGLNIPLGVYGIKPQDTGLSVVRREFLVPEYVGKKGNGISVEVLHGGETLPWDVVRKEGVN